MPTWKGSGDDKRARQLGRAGCLERRNARSGAEPAAVRKASFEGKLIVSESVVAEIRPVFADQGSFEEFMQDWGLEFVPSSLQSALLAGEMLARFLSRKRERTGRILADFLIGAHAQVHADRLLARDRGYLRDYFTDLAVWDPSA